MSDTIPRPGDLRPTRRVGNYELREEIGAGGMSRVYRAVKTGSDTSYAVKVIRIEDMASDYERRLRREPEVQRGIGHRNIVELMDWFREHDEFYLVMEFVDGRSLSSIIYRESGPMPFARAREYMRQTLAAVEHLHTLGIIHRDIKPSNILVARDGTVKLADFGIAKFAWQQGETKTQKGLGTPEYMSPEQARGKEIDSRTDIYSLGITLFEMLTARKPFSRQEQTPMAYVEVIQSVLTEPLPDPRAFQPGLPASVVELLTKATAKNPSERYQTAAELLAALDAVDENEMSPPTVVGASVPVGGRRENRVDSSAASPRLGQDEEEKKVSSAPIWIMLALVILGIGGYFGYRWYQENRGVQVTATLNDGSAMEVTRSVVADYTRFARQHIVPGLASLYGERNVEYFRFKKATRKMIEDDSRKFYNEIERTDRMDVEIKSARALNDSTIQSEWWIGYDRLKDDGTRLRGLTSNLITLSRQGEGGEWLITRQVQKWINRENTPPPAADTASDIAPVPSTSETPQETPSDQVPEPTVKDVNPPPADTARVREPQRDGGSIFNRNPPESRVRRRNPDGNGNGNVFSPARQKVDAKKERVNKNKD